MSAWDELKPYLIELERGCLRKSPSTDVTPSDPNGPFDIVLKPWALSIAEDLHRRLGDAVKLQVGAMEYPRGALCGDWFGFDDDDSLSLEPPGVKSDLNPNVVTAELVGPSTMASGWPLQTEMRLRNHTEDDSPSKVI